MKAVVLGFDGLDPTLIERHLSKDRLPAFDQLQREGARSLLQSTVIPMSPAAWSSFLTGTNPGKHGIYDFITRTGDGLNDFEVVTADHREAPLLSEYCEAVGLTSGVVGVPVTYPVQQGNGFMVSGFPTPTVEGSYRPETLPEDSPVAIDALHPEILYDGTNAEEFIEDQFRLWDAMESFYEFALTDLDWDVFVNVFKGTDDIAHVAWDEAALDEAYQRADELVERTITHLESLDEEYLLIVMSDHGFGPIDKTLFPNNVLLELGYASLRNSIGTRLRRFLSGEGVNLLTAYRVLARFGLAESVLAMSYEDSIVGAGLERLRHLLFLGPNDLDPETASFSRGNFGQIFIEDETVDQERLKRDLLDYTVDDEAIIDQVFAADEEFHGPMVDRAPDLMIGTPEYRYVASRGFALATNRVLTDHPLQRAADHKPTGVFYAYGPGVEVGASPGPISLEDLLPTIMAAFDAPVPAYSDGSVIEGLGLDHPGSEEYDLGRRGRNHSPVDTEAIRDQLESLGYMG